MARYHVSVGAQCAVVTCQTADHIADDAAIRAAEMASEREGWVVVTVDGPAAYLARDER